MLILVFIFGAILGSFLNVVLLRKNTGESFIYGDSRCFSCGEKLKPYEMVPIFSFIILRRKCGHCGSKISWQYPIIELITGLLSLAIAVRYTPYAVSGSYGLWLMAYGFFFSAFCVLLLIALYDFKHKIIDTHFLYIFGSFSIVAAITRHYFLADLLSSFLIASFFYLLWYFSKGIWMGRGDSSLALCLSLFLGYPLNLAMLVLSFWIGGVVGIILLLTGGGRFSIKSEIPFGPFLAVSVFIVWNFSTFFSNIYHVYFF